MKNNIITLSETKDYKYIGLPVPKDARNVKFCIEQYYGYPNEIVRGLEYNNRIDYFTYIISFKELLSVDYYELMGILGETLTEEQAREIFPEAQFMSSVNPGLSILESLIESKGVKVKNNLKKPVQGNYTILPTRGIDFKRLQKDLSDWELEEAEVKKVVIIKIKK